MGIMERLGRVVDTYVSERDQLIEAEQERRRVFTGHAFWPQECSEIQSLQCLS